MKSIFNPSSGLFVLPMVCVETCVSHMVVDSWGWVLPGFVADYDARAFDVGDFETRRFRNAQSRKASLILINQKTARLKGGFFDSTGATRNCCSKLAVLDLRLGRAILPNRPREQRGREGGR